VDLITDVARGRQIAAPESVMTLAENCLGSLQAAAEEKVVKGERA
jgi:hypothetical protein